MNRFDSLIKNHLCLGCGLCASLGKEKGYKISINEKGFYEISLPDDSERDLTLEMKMANCCPSITIMGSGSSNVWGDNINVVDTYSLDDDIRFKASSGGFVTAACIYLLESGRVNAILHVGKNTQNALHNELKISKSREEIINNCSSRYAPAVMFEQLKQLLDSSNDTYAFVGKSCDVLCIKNFEQEFPQYKRRILYTISIFCAGMPSYNATQRLATKIYPKGDIKNVRYRGQGWPGHFTVQYKDGSVKTTTYENAWMNYLGKDIHFRCKICPDSIGTIADISVGDSWRIVNQKTSFEDTPGISCVLAHSEAGEKLIKEMKTHGIIAYEGQTESYLNKIQPNHIRKRLSSAFKMPVMRCLIPGTFRLKNTNQRSLFFQYNFLRGIKEAIGTRSRYKKWISK